MTYSLTLIGYWIEVPGQILSAISETMIYTNNNGNDLHLFLGIVGDGLQSIGEGVQAMGGEKPLSFIASFIEAVGAAATSFAGWKQITDDSEVFLKLEILGDGLQGAGAALSAEVGDDDFLNLGDWLESIGATLEAVGGTISLEGEEEKGLQLSVIGSWLQVIGGMSSLIYLYIGGKE